MASERIFRYKILAKEEENVSLVLAKIKNNNGFGR